MSPRNVSLFLKPVPPRADELVRALFVNRLSELEQACEEVAAVLEEGPAQVLAIVGPARVGKSHLLRRVVQEVAGTFDACVSVRVAPGVTDERDVLRRLLQQLRAGLQEAWASREDVPPEDEDPLLPLDRLLAVYAEAVNGTAAEIEVAEGEVVSRQVKRTGKLRGSFSSHLGAVLGKVGLRAEVAQESGEGEQASGTRTVRIAPFDGDALSDLVVLAHALIRQRLPEWKTLLVFDDFDLLKRNREGFYDPGPLLQQIYRLAQAEGVYVLTTVREDTYEQNEKSFHRIAWVAPFEDEAHLRAVYDRHVAQFYGGEDPFRGGWVDEAARRCRGRIGVFLQTLRDAFDKVRPRLSELQLESWLEEEWDSRATKAPEAAERFLRAVVSGGGRVDKDQAPLLRTSPLFWFLVEDYSSEDQYEVDPIALSYFREWASKGRLRLPQSVTNLPGQRSLSPPVAQQSLRHGTSEE